MKNKLDKLLENQQISKAILEFNKGEYQASINLAEEILKKNNGLGFGWKLLGASLSQIGRFEESLAPSIRAVELLKNDAEAYYNLSKVFVKIGNLANAIITCKEAIKINPQFAEAYSILGSYLREVGDLDESLASCKESLRLKPNLAEAHNNIANTQLDLNLTSSAIEHLMLAIKLKPGMIAAHINLGNAFSKMEKYNQAIIHYENALKINPNTAEALSNLGNCHRELVNYQYALRFYDSAIKVNPKLAEVHANIGFIYKEMGRYAEALVEMSQAVQTDPKSSASNQALAEMLAHLSTWDEVTKYSDLAVTLNDNFGKLWESRLYISIYHPTASEADIFNEHVRWGLRQSQNMLPKSFPKNYSPDGRTLRVGFVSPDFRQHSCKFYFEPLFENYDKNKFEFYAYSNVKCEDQVTAKFKQHFTVWRNIRGVPDSSAFEIIRNDEIDILVDACGHMDGGRTSLFSLKPAPVQATWLGAAYTSGLKEIDYIIFDPHMAPAGTLATEEIFRLPRTWAAFRPGLKASCENVSPSPSLTNGYITFGYSGRSERLNSRVFNTWAEILKRLPKAKLMLDSKVFADIHTQKYYQNILLSHGISQQRLILRCSQNIFQGLSDVDILLDSFPHSGGTMLFDALWMGVPVLTLASRPPVGRIGTSLLMNLGLPKWVAASEAEYIEKAIEYASDPMALSELRAGMRARMQSSPIMDELGFASDMGVAFIEMWKKYQSEI
jgi:protein O-GlcNAc transferase